MTIRELAKKAGVSTATVSRVFSNSPLVSAEVRDRVLAIAKTYHYHPRIFSKFRNIVIFSPYKQVYPVQSYVEMVISELTHTLSLHDYRTEILQMDLLENDLKLLNRFQFCGAVAIGAESSLFREWDSKFTAPLILIDRKAPAKAEEVYSIRSDESQAMELAVECFAQGKAKKIGTIIYGRKGEGSTLLREEGLRKALLKHGYEASDSLIRFSLDDHYVETVGQLLKRGIDALFCPGGNAGLVASYALSLYDKRIPEDVALIASERAVFSRYTTPPQTTISQDYSVLAEKVAELLDARFNGEDCPRETILPYKLIRRASTK